MKKYSQLIITIINFCAIALIIALAVPAVVPIHFGISGAADSWGSKWIYLIFAAVPLILEIIYLVYAHKNTARDEHNRPYERRVAVVIEYIFILINWGFLAIINIGTTQLSPRHLLLITSLILGGTLVIMCNIYGKIKQNRYFGVRTKATLANERIWNLTNRASGYVGFGAGILLIVWSFINYRFSLVSITPSLILTIVWVMGAAAVAPSIISAYYVRKLSHQ